VAQRGVSPKLAQSASAVHAPHLPASHTGAEAVQSAAPAQPSHTCVDVLHTLAPAQSSSPRHATHSRADVSQRPVVQSASPTQPTHACAVTSHTGADESGQSPSATHATHVPVARSHAGVAPVQAGAQPIEASLASAPASPASCVASMEPSPGEASRDASTIMTQRPSRGV